ncbi:MAG: protease complex subunit PrcB family protein [Lachnospiraceae bacterium]|nr:protease complex subunit PrcB family protein [Lachnospiraceae bacterium]
MMFRKLRKIILLVLAFFVAYSLAGCGKKGEEMKKDLDFTVCDVTRMPEELLDIIEEKKGNIFKLSYMNDDYMYIAIGYGEHSRQNLNVVVEDLYMTDNAIYVETNLITEENTSTDGQKGETSMYPYIVLKCEKYDLPVVFDID